MTPEEIRSKLSNAGVDINTIRAVWEICQNELALQRDIDACAALLAEAQDKYLRLQEQMEASE